MRWTVLNDLMMDVHANRSDPLALLVLGTYRFGRAALRMPSPLRQVASVAYVLLNALVVRLVVGVDLPRAATVGPGLRLHHLARGSALHPAAVIGSHCVLFHSVTIGQRRAQRDAPAPVIGDRVILWPGCTVAGAVRVGDGAQVGAGALVLVDVPAGGRAVSRPADVS